MSPFDLILVALAAAEFRWRQELLRIPLVLLAVMTLVFATGLGPAYRRAMSHPRRVVMPAPPSQPKELGSEYASGVQVMADEARRDLSGVYLPLAVLVWLSVYPAVFPGHPSRRNRPMETPQPAPVPESP